MGPIFFAIQLLLNPQLPYLEAHQHITGNISHHLRNDPTFKEGIRFLQGHLDTSKILSNATKHRNTTAVVVEFVKALKKNEVLKPTYKNIQKNVKMLSNAGKEEFVARPDFKSFFDDIRGDLDKIENAHDKMKTISKDIMNGSDFYEVFGLSKLNFLTTRMKEMVNAPKVEQLFTLLDGVNFDLRKIVKLVILYAYDVKLF
ncbi:hypothetical protein Trydic_g23542 [Trypoxylus dichotomus]